MRLAQRPTDQWQPADGIRSTGLLRHRPVYMLIAADRIAEDVGERRRRGYWRRRFPDDLIRELPRALTRRGLHPHGQVRPAVVHRICLSLQPRLQIIDRFS